MNLHLAHLCTHAGEALLRYRNEHLRHMAPEDLPAFDAVLKMLDQSVKFHLPPNGRYLQKNDPYTPQDLELIRPPFDLMALEFTISVDKWEIADWQDLSSKRIMILKRLDSGGFEVFAINHDDAQKLWMLAPMSVLVPPSHQFNLQNVRRPDGKIEQTASFQDHVILPGTLRNIAKQSHTDPQVVRERIVAEGLQDLGIIFEFLLAINCSNVDFDTLPPSSALNRKRQRNNKLPFYTYKVLKLRTDSTRYALNAKGDSALDTRERVGVRQHLRRGHIRHYDPERNPRYRQKRSVWIEAMLVGDPLKGRIDKEYQLR